MLDSAKDGKGQSLVQVENRDNQVAHVQYRVLYILVLADNYHQEYSQDGQNIDTVEEKGNVNSEPLPAIPKGSAVGVVLGQVVDVEELHIDLDNVHGDQGLEREQLSDRHEHGQRHVEDVAEQDEPHRVEELDRRELCLI